jgi:lipoate-protein ligase A
VQIDAQQIVPYSVAGAGEQLARSEALLRAVAAGAAPATLRWYSYDSRATILGVGQGRELVDRQACDHNSVAVVKRSSGGGIVFAGPELLALDVALPAAHPLAGRDVIEAYRWVGEIFLQGLAELAPSEAPSLELIDVATARADQQAQRTAPPGTAAHLRGLACFGVLSPYEVALRRDAGLAKLVGLAQVRRRGVVLHQVGVYTHFDASGFAACLALPESARDALADDLVPRVASLDQLSPTAADVPQLMAVVNRAAIARINEGAPVAGAGR